MKILTTDGSVSLINQGWHGGAAGTVATSQFPGPLFDPELELLSVEFQMFTLYLHGFPQGSLVTSHLKRNMPLL